MATNLKIPIFKISPPIFAAPFWLLPGAVRPPPSLRYCKMSKTISKTETSLEESHEETGVMLWPTLSETAEKSTRQMGYCCTFSLSTSRAVPVQWWLQQAEHRRWSV